MQKKNVSNFNCCWLFVWLHWLFALLIHWNLRFWSMIKIINVTKSNRQQFINMITLCTLYHIVIFMSHQIYHQNLHHHYHYHHDVIFYHHLILLLICLIQMMIMTWNVNINKMWNFIMMMMMMMILRRYWWENERCKMMITEWEWEEEGWWLILMM